MRDQHQLLQGLGRDQRRKPARRCRLGPLMAVRAQLQGLAVAVEDLRRDMA
jgi:hypothetical protein